VDDVHRYVAAADCVITKPGGVTTSEVLAIGRPLLLTAAIPGQEEGNRRLLCAAGAALDASNQDSLRRNLQALFADPAKLAEMSRAARALGRPDAAFRIAGTVATSLFGVVAA
jgi:processive 1,2-diacylglycerol beta-glucosyltransferase